MRKVKRGKPLSDSTKGSLEYSIYEVDRAFRAQFGLNSWNYCVCDTFADHIILRDFDLPQDEYWLVSYTRDADGDYTFAQQDAWEQVQLAYTPTKNPVQPEEGPPDDGMPMDMGDRARIRQRAFVESRGPIMLLDSTTPSGARRVRGIGMSADSINDNMRRYPAPVIADAVKRAQAQLGNVAGRVGRGPLMGEAEHPQDKGEHRALWLNTVFVWDSIQFDGKQVLLEGYIVPTSQGQDAIILLEHKVIPGLSTRSYGRSVLLRESGAIVEELLEMEFAGYDATIEPADMAAEMAFSDARRHAAEEHSMRLGLLRGISGLRDKDTDSAPASGASPKDKETPQDAPPPADPPVRRESAPAPIADSLSADDRRRLDELAVRERRLLISDAIDQALSDSPYNAQIRQGIADAVRGLDLPNVEAVAGAIERQRAVADAMLSQAQLQIMGRPSPRGPIISGGDSPALVPDYAKPQLALTDSLILATGKPSQLSRAAHMHPTQRRFLEEYLRRFDAANKSKLLREAREFQDAETASDLTLPTAYMRTILTELLPTLVATSIFDVQSVDAAPIVNIGYETYSNETGVALTVTDEAQTATDDTWVALAHQHLTFGTVVVTSSPAGTTFVEGTDYVIDYLGGRIMGLSAGSINGAAVLIDYGYSAFRKGEMQSIERGQMTLAFYPLTIAADRLATQISSESIVFSKGVLGYDVVGRVINRIIFELRRAIDGGLMRLALAESLRIASNSGGTWTAATDTYDDLAALIGVSKVKVANRFFEPTGILMNLTNSDRIGNWDAFTQAGSRPDDDMLGATGFAGRLKGLPVFASTEYPDGYIEVINREIVYYRIAQPMQLKGPYPSYDTDGKLIAADQYYVEEYNGATGDPGHSGKGSHVIIA